MSAKDTVDLHYRLVQCRTKLIITIGMGASPSLADLTSISKLLGDAITQLDEDQKIIKQQRSALSVL